MIDNPFDADGGKTRNQKEYALQVCVAEQLDAWFPYLRWTAIPNRPGDAADGFFKKKMGVKAGMVDILCSWEIHPTLLQEILRFLKLKRFMAVHGGLIELKVNARVSNDQNRIMSSWGKIGWHTAVCYTAREVKDTLTKWGNKPQHGGCYEPNYQNEQQKFASAFDYYAPQKP